MRIVPGRVVLELYPTLYCSVNGTTGEPVFGDFFEQRLCAFRVLDGAHKNIIALKFIYAGPIEVELAIPADGSLDLEKLRQNLEGLVSQAILARWNAK